ncbi:hypothetical protein JOE46_001965 [Rhodococcus sp. PvR099]|nr:hypothetical protein [Rhodococcus sp. PvR099]
MDDRRHARFLIALQENVLGRWAEVWTLLNAAMYLALGWFAAHWAEERSPVLRSAVRGQLFESVHLSGLGLLVNRES